MFLFCASGNELLPSKDYFAIYRARTYMVILSREFPNSEIAAHDGTISLLYSEVLDETGKCSCSTFPNSAHLYL
jgi:hypothetical protein